MLFAVYFIVGFALFCLALGAAGLAVERVRYVLRGENTR